MARWLVTGAGGMLAHDLLPRLTDAGHDVTPLTRTDLDITDASACRAAVEGHDVVANLAAWTAVDDAESHEGAAFAVNALGAANVAAACERSSARLVHVSTDYVFSGDTSTPYAVNAPVAPRSAYGRTKAAGEWAVLAHCPTALVVRTAWLYGAGGPNFVATISRLATERDTIAVVDDQHGQPTWTADLAEAIPRLVEADAQGGVWHGTGSGQTTWFDFARAIFEELGLDPERVTPTTTASFPRPAPRPTFSVLDDAKWRTHGLDPLPHWRDGLNRAAPSVLRTS
ncbi:dTDP-4-dehydrorhamnose reductase [Janibacter sp. HTCC2649]|uniref:dTDP-4-dehydrorhamnose reductase n=1 Tax=Janibacter sp. HTCC2649 TaxID=313589 RepID=UPI0000670514|nr:dTDP-4-dehydrorhamnose reductase [Janibacter sp. HTCC2649]EAP96897.1 dTDP-4-dehydrorhamnose reductase [Janibacter sp. HTCC2649]EAP96902.1 dTDP-4-dehydrorhamnose reductase [Janibacter sp. HTCC2649]